ncbi:MAG TPA: hypothetical protein VF074_12480 [Pyrinomonadaceae bacterium]
MDAFIRIRPALLPWPKAVETESELHPDIERLRLVDKFKSYEKLKHLPKLKALWCFGIDARALDQIAQCGQLEELHLDYRVKTGDLRVLKNLKLLKVLTLNSCSQINSLNQISEFANLEGLLIENFKNVHSIHELSRMTKLKQLAVSGSIWTRMKIDTLEPLKDLTSLEYLDLSNLKVTDESLKPLEPLRQLRKLDIANFYPMKEFAWLSGRLTNTHCTWFAPYIRMNLECEKCKAPTRLMLSGKGKPTLCSNCDALRLGRHVEEFERISRSG